MLPHIVECASGGLSDRSQHQSLTSGGDDPPEQEQSPTREKTPKKETAQKYSSQIEKAKKNTHNGELDEDMPSSGNNEDLVKKQLPNIKSNRELNGYTHDESIEPAQGN